ncbi:MAG TPA: iron ABC transporter permease [Bosea sp. (in: a-proteobacteria)]|jgi:iron complex transport system permease protein|uniref:FecCD family ABC transporter permease n=1 Tax=Bosea sp. (in: a-proteobacteria) TaxID=1871050 RepID=UPI002E0E1471|nr:iron ABC transporter permease [Bosea sp. (in: a-proteobacteria)]
MRRRPALFVVSATAVSLATLAGMMAGARWLPPDAVIAGLFGSSGDEASLIMRELRLPRIVLGGLVGAALGLSGAIIQSATRNPFGDPGLLGINAGASLAVVLGAGLLGWSGMPALLALAAGGAAMAACAVAFVAGTARGAVAPVQIALSGVAVGALCYGLTQAIALADPERFDLVRNWRVGALSGDAHLILPAVLPVILSGFGLAALIAPRLDLLALGEDRAASLGISVGRTQALCFLAVVLLAGAATAAAGPIAFVGLAAPHIARRLVGANEARLLPQAALLGAALTIAADALGRVAVLPGELPVGVVTALLGAPVLVLVARGHRRLERP